MAYYVMKTKSMMAKFFKVITIMKQRGLMRLTEKAVKH